MTEISCIFINYLFNIVKGIKLMKIYYGIDQTNYEPICFISNKFRKIKVTSRFFEIKTRPWLKYLTNSNLIK